MNRITTILALSLTLAACGGGGGGGAHEEPEEAALVITCHTGEGLIGFTKMSELYAFEDNGGACRLIEQGTTHE